MNYSFGKSDGREAVTLTKHHLCDHLNGWYGTVHFLMFEKRMFVCSDCGEFMEKAPNKALASFGRMK